MSSGPQGGPSTTPLVVTEVVDMKTLTDTYNTDLPQRPTVYWFASGRRFIDSGCAGGFYTGCGVGDTD